MFNRESKDSFIKYVSGNLRKLEKPNEPQWGRININNSDLYKTLDQKFPNGYYIKDYLQGKDINGNYNDSNIALYGKYLNLSGTTEGGFIVICTVQGNVLQIITNFTSGVKIGDLKVVEITETGKVVAVEQNISTKTTRYLYLNNFFVLNDEGKYEIKIRESRIFPSEYPYSVIKIDKMYRNIHSDECIFAGTYSKGDPGQLMAVIIIMKNQIGEETQWIYKEITVTNSSGNIFENGTVDDIYADFEQKKIVFILSSQIFQVGSWWNFVVEFTESSSKIKSFNIMGIAKIKNFNEMYLLNVEYPSDYQAKIVVYQYKNENWETIYNLQQKIDVKESSKSIIKLDNEIFFFVVLKNVGSYKLYLFKMVNANNIVYAS